MEELLNKLIEKGWKPRGNKVLNGLDIVNNKRDIKYKWKDTIAIQCYDKNDKYLGTSFKKLRELVSKESGLWQFVCENNLNYNEDDCIYDVRLKHYAEDDHESPFTYASPVWYIIESALTDEDKLEDFILDNVKLGNED